MTDAADDLTDWLAELRARLARGDLDGREAIAITVEPRPGARAPSSAPILAAEVPA